ncbi:MAG: hypothetical protein Q9P14_10170 [candidate division KSB1 bacterium]|nr:hypothetical protein [candidate division KSB1 bacterium]
MMVVVASVPAMVIAVIVRMLFGMIALIGMLAMVMFFMTFVMMRVLLSRWVFVLLMLFM